MTGTTRRYTLRHLKTAARRWGATVDTSTLDSGFVNVDAPTGKVWGCSGVHSLCVSWEWELDHGQRPTWIAEKSAAIEDCLERMEMGLEDCTEEDCDACSEAG